MNEYCYSVATKRYTIVEVSNILENIKIKLENFFSL